MDGLGSIHKDNKGWRSYAGLGPIVEFKPAPGRVRRRVSLGHLLNGPVDLAGVDPAAKLPIDLIIGDKTIRQRIENLEDIHAIEESWLEDLKTFEETSRKYYLY